MGISLEAQQALQRDYYRQTASSYDQQHLGGFDEHQFALSVLSGLLRPLKITSILDIGSGTGRTLEALRIQFPDVRIVGVEPSLHLREQGYVKGISEADLVDGDAMNLSYGDGEFDLVTEFATLHHIPHPQRAVGEMLRVAKMGIFISDCNNYGAGNKAVRFSKNLLRLLGLWKIFDWIRTGGRGYMESAGDGVFYSYSVFDNYEQVRNACESVHVFNTVDSEYNLLGTASHVAILGMKINPIKPS